MFLALLFATGSARAGYYTVTYSGGETVTTGPRASPFPGGPYFTGYYSGNYGSSSYTYTGWGVDNQTAYSGSILCAGEITATFTYHPGNSGSSSYGYGYGTSVSIEDDPPPKVAVVAETCSAYWDGSGPVDEGSASNGLDFPEILSYGGGHSVGTRYKIQEEPGESFTVKCSPHASVSGTGVVGPPQEEGDGHCSVSYHATASPLEVNLSGGIGAQGNKQFLIGQHVGATVSNSGLTANSYNWMVSGGEPFKNWSVTEIGTISKTTFETLGTETGSALGFYFKKPLFIPQIAQVSCAVHLVVPSGSLPAAGLDATPSRRCWVDKPFNSLSAWTGTTQEYSTPDGKGMWFYGANYGNHYSGILFNGVVTTPVEYGLGGGWNYTQLVTTQRNRHMSGVLYHQSYNGLLALDTWFPYTPRRPEPDYPADGIDHITGDRPAEPFDSATTYIGVLDSFVIYTLYMPPSQDSRYVPLKNFTWYWEGHAQPDNSGIWQISNQHGGWTSGEDFPTHPMWDDNWSFGDYIP